MSDEDIANREYNVETGGSEIAMPTSKIGGLGEMGAPMEDSPLLDTSVASSTDTDDASNNQGNVIGAGTNRMLDNDDPDDADPDDRR